MASVVSSLFTKPPKKLYHFTACIFATVGEEGVKKTFFFLKKECSHLEVAKGVLPILIDWLLSYPLIMEKLKEPPAATNPEVAGALKETRSQLTGEACFQPKHRRMGPFF